MTGPYPADHYRGSTHRSYRSCIVAPSMPVQMTQIGAKYLRGIYSRLIRSACKIIPVNSIVPVSRSIRRARPLRTKTGYRSQMFDDSTRQRGVREPSRSTVAKKCPPMKFSDKPASTYGACHRELSMREAALRQSIIQLAVLSTSTRRCKNKNLARFFIHTIRQTELSECTRFGLG